MNWIIWTLVMFFSSIFLYIGVRELKKFKLPVPLVNFGMLGLPVLPLVLWIIIKGERIELSLIEAILLVISTIILSVGGNWSSIKAQNMASNPGFSLIIQKSYGSFTIFLAPLLFGSVLGPIEILGAFLVFISAGMISIDFSKKIIQKESKWLALTALAYLLFGFLSISNKFFLNRGLDIIEILLIIFSVNLIANSVLVYGKKSELKFSKRIVSILCLLAVLSFVFNFSMIEAIAVAPNIGFVNTANAGSIAVLAVVSRIIYKDELGIRKVIGIIGVLVGLAMIFV